MKLKDLRFTDIRGRVRTLPTLTDANRVVVTELGFNIWKKEFQAYGNSEVTFIDRGACWGGLAVIVEDMQAARNNYINRKAEALS